MKKQTLLVFFSIILIIIPYFINVYSIFRLLSYLIGIALFSIIMFKNKKNIVVNIIVLITIFSSSYFMDYFLTCHTRIPIFSKQVISSNEVKSYYSLTYKLDVCDNNYKIDRFYSNDYSCSEFDLESISINDFLSSYEKNKKAYLKIEAKISAIIGESYFEISPYDLKEEPKNGEVTFKNDIKIRVPLNKSILVNNYKIYDEITIIGRVGNIEKTPTGKTYNLIDSVIYRSNIYDEYNISYDIDKKCELDKTLLASTETNNYYTSCLNNIIVKFDETNKYDLDYVLLDGKIDLEDLINRSLKSTTFDNGKSYESDDLKFVVCHNNDVIFSDNNDKALLYCNINNDSEDGV